MDLELSSPETTPNKPSSLASPGSSVSSSSSSSSSSSASSKSSLAFSNAVSNPPDQNGGSGDSDVKLDVAVSENEEEEFASGAEDFELAKEVSGEVSGGEDGGGDFFPASPEFSKVGEQRPIAKLSVDDDDEEFDLAVSEVRAEVRDRESETLVDESLVQDENGGDEGFGNEELKKDEGLDGKDSGVLSEVVVEEEKIGDGDSVVEEVKVEVLDSGTAIVGDAEGIEGSEIKPVEAVEVQNDFETLELVGSKSLSLDSDFTDNVAEESKDVEAVVEKEAFVAGSDESASKEASGEDVPKSVPAVEAVVEKEALCADSDEAVPKDLPESEDGVRADSEVEEKKKEDSEVVVAADSDEVPTGASSVNGVSEPTEDSKPSDNGTHVESDGSDKLPVTKSAEPESTPSREIVLEDEDEEEGEDNREITGGSDSDEIVYGNAAQNFFKQLERQSAGGEDVSREMEGQIVTDSDEEVDTEEEEDDDEGGKEMFDSAALAALLKAATGASSDGGGNVTITSPDGSRLFSVERPAGLGMGSSLPKFAARPNHSSLFAPSTPAVGAPEEKLSDEEKKKLEKFHQVRVKYLRLVNRLGISIEESISRQVLYRLALVSGRVSNREYSVEAAKETALKLEAESRDDLNFSLNLLVIGKSGVGKSATINSIFGEQKSSIHAFGPATTSVKEIVGMVDGVKIRVFDSPGLKTAAVDQSYNRRILANVKSVTKKCPPDIVLYVDRLDTQSRDLNDLPLLRSITSALGPAIWRSGIVTLTHAASSPPDGPTGAPLNYELFVGQRSQILQQSIGQAVGDLRAMSPSLMNPISLVENHPSCRKNRDGQKVLPNGQAWRSQLLHLCYSMKILSEASGLSKPQEAVDQRKLFGFRVRSPPLPYLLSWLLQSRTHPKLAADQGGDNGDSDIDLDDLSDSDGDQEEEDEFDQLPPFKPLRRTQFAKLSKDQKRAYLEEYDYRVKLLQKKQWREELRRMKEMKKGGGNKLGSAADQYDGEEDPENGAPAAIPVALPDMILPPSFDGVSPAYRYRFLEPTSQFLARPVLDTHGWDHDCGYDGVNIEHSLAIASQFPGAISVQITKDKKEFNLHLDSSIAAKHGETGSTMAGFDIQNIGKQLAYIVRGETKMKSFKRNKTAAGVSVTFLGENVSTGVKLEDQFSLGKRVVLVGSTGVVKSQSDAAYGANLEVRLREADFPIGQDQSTLGLSLVKWRGDLALGANFQSQFSLGRSYKMAVRAGLNNKLSGQISVRTSSSEQLQIAFIALLPIVRSIVKALWPGAAAEGYSVY